MYKILVVDDEAIIRNGIKQIIPWNKLDVDEVKIAASGKEAVEVLQNSTIDLMITDINMMNMDGLELIAKVNETNPEMRIVVLTGYNSFEYSQQCCRMEVHDFLLKPIDEIVLEKAIQKQLNVISEMEKKNKVNRILLRGTSVKEQAAFEQTVKKLLHAEENIEAATALMSEYGYENGDAMQLFIVGPIVNTVEYEDELLDFLQTKSICISIFDAKGKGITFEDEAGRIVVVAFLKDDEGAIEEQIVVLRMLLKEELELSFSILLGSKVYAVESLYISYNDAVALFDTKLINNDTIIRQAHDERNRKIFTDTIREYTDKMIESIGNKDVFLDVFDAFLKYTNNYALSDTMRRRTTFSLISKIYFENYMITDNNPPNDLTALLEAMMSMSGIEVENVARDFLVNMLYPEQQHRNESIIKAKQYVRDHLAEDLSVSSLADRYFFTINHFSRLFKKETGEGCNEYIVRKRMEKAMILLETTNIKSGQISVMVGYNDTNYFSLAFKRYTSFSPKEYRENSRVNRAN